MKAISKNETDPKAFCPVTLSITFDTQDELDTFGALFNVSAVSDLFHPDATESIRRAIDSNDKLKNRGNMTRLWGKVSSALQKA